MKPSPIDKYLPLLMDLMFGLYFVSEVLFPHSRISQVCMLLFFGAVAFTMLRRKKAYFSWWMLASIAVILWSAVVTYGWAIDRSTSQSMVITLGVNLVFYFFLFQYLLLQGDMRRYFTVFVVAVCALSVYSFILEQPFDMNLSRLGIAAGINPNVIGMFAAFAMGLSLVLAKQKSAFWLATAIILLPAVVLSKSAKAAALVAFLIVVIYLVLYPKRWLLKSAILLVAGGATFYFLIYQENVISTGIFARLQGMAHYMISGSGQADSVVIRESLIQLAIDSFRQRPMHGFGLGCYQFIDNINTYSHNNYTELLVSGGVVLAILYYVPQLVALALSARVSARNRRAGAPATDLTQRASIGILATLLIAQLIMDYGMVSYFERMSAVYLVLLVAATQIGKHNVSYGSRFFEILAHPRTLFAKQADQDGKKP